MDTLQKLLPWVTALPLLPKIVVSVIVIAFTILILLLIWLPASVEGPTSEESKEIVSIDRQKARFGVTLGWQLARYEFISGSPFPEARVAQKVLESELKQLLEQDSLPFYGGIKYRELVSRVLVFYSTSDIEKHAAILIGISAFRTSLVGISSNQENNEEIKDLAFSALEDIDTNIVRNKKHLFEVLMKEQPKTVAEVLQHIGDQQGRPNQSP